jgi:hypothetical protein
MNLDDAPKLPSICVGGLAIDNYRGRVVRVDEDMGKGYYCTMLSCSTLADFGQNIDPLVYVTEDYYLLPLVLNTDGLDERLNVDCLTCGAEVQVSSTGSENHLLQGLCGKCADKYDFETWGVVDRGDKEGN